MSFLLSGNPKWKKEEPSLRREVQQQTNMPEIFIRKQTRPKNSSVIFKKSWKDYRYKTSLRPGSIMSGGSGVDLRQLLPAPIPTVFNRISEIYFYPDEIVSKHYVPGRDIVVKTHKWPETWPLVIHHM